MSNFIISVVSHNHFDLIKKIGCLGRLSSLDFVTIIIKTNTNENIKEYCLENNIYYIEDHPNLGFGENNNKVFEFCKKEFDCSDDDYFIVMNPDVELSVQSCIKLYNSLEVMKPNVAAINLYKDLNFSEHDYSIRLFPKFSTFIKSFFGFGNSTLYKKEVLTNPTDVDWAAGSFLAFKFGFYDELSGFDTRYFMYCEDVDICFRASLLGTRVKYFPGVKAIHYAQHNNRKLFSKHFFWHVYSSILFLIVKARNEK
ncbi:glycosyltransferase family 2 protein [Shewanella sp. AS16]|uniref:glycosyltransferase family 2 protein n=1 Tax=Shewanella sp. AS16 TaxID=2907625 RepID=UPI001F4745A8|nr:glycosyltransferase family 2 protein [Shewanella sp. AS16]MCE9686735.1 glycosyltransferase family 2 protein [Shewanella sp. AS16]